MRLSDPQIRCLKEVRRGTRTPPRVDATDVEGRFRRTFESLFGLGLIEWDPIRIGAVQLTFAGSETLNKIIVRENARSRLRGSL